MAHLIEPCCSHRHLSELRSKLGKGGTEDFEGYGDLSLTELLPPLVTHYHGTKLLIVAPSLPEQATDIIKACMKKEWVLVDGSGKIPAITHLTIVADLSPEKSPVASQWTKDNPFGERMTLIDKSQEETVILLPDFAITGPVNLRYGHRFIATATTNPETITTLWKMYETTGAEKTSYTKKKSSKKEMPGQEAGQKEEEQEADQTIL